MWRFKPFMPKEQTGLEGRTIDICNLKVHVRNVIAEGGFSCVYLALDAINGSKQYAVKHIICNDEESLELVMKEISVMKLLRDHPNIVTLYTHTILNMGRTNEALLVMEYCEKSLVNVLESREAAYFEEKLILAIFRDVCNAVFAMHCQSPPIAHRDLKVENLLLGTDGLWKLCDFGSTSTNHKRFEKPEEMGIEEDNIRKHTTPAYRAPEMWDLFRRELLNEKVDIWALGCLLFRISFLKSAFDGESKLQILNGNYRIPELPKYSSDLADLIRDLLQSSPVDRPDITQVWFRVNGLLPDGLQKSLPDRPPKMQQHGTDTHEEDNPRPKNRASRVPRRSPPLPPITEPRQNVSPISASSRLSGWGPIGSFWTTQDENDSLVADDEMKPKFDEEPSSNSSSRHDNSRPEKPRNSKSENSPVFQNDTFNAFAAEFNTYNIKKSGKEELLEVDVETLKEQLKQANVDKAEVTSKYEKLSAICRSQGQELQELKQALASRTPPNLKASKNQISHGIQLSSTPPQQRKKNSPSPDTKPMQPCADDPNPQTSLMNSSLKSARTRNGHQNKQAAKVTSGANTWGFKTDSFTANLAASYQISVPVNELNNSQRFGDSMNIGSKSASQPAGWAGF